MLTVHHIGTLPRRHVYLHGTAWHSMKQHSMALISASPMLPLRMLTVHHIGTLPRRHVYLHSTA
jgi:hypothetical protein